MTEHKEILEKAIQKAIDGGWTSGAYELQLLRNPPKTEPAEGSNNEVLQFITDNMIFKMVRDRVIFNHDFAKALWGEEATYDMTHIVQPDNSYKMNVRPAWQYHLQQMVIADDPI